MDIYVYNKNNECIDVIDTYQSAIWDLSYYDAGKFELYIAANEKIVRLMVPDNRLIRDKDISDDGTMRHVMIIKKVVLSTDDETGDNLIVTGFDLKIILRQRIVWQQTNLSGTIEDCIKKLLIENVISPDIVQRKLDNFTFRPEKNIKKIQKQITGDNLMDAVVGILSENGIGWDVYIDSIGNYVMTTYTGIDRSVNQDVNPCVVFSAANENIVDDTYTLDLTDYANVVLTAGEGEGLARRRLGFGETEGIDRYEIYKDARDISSNNEEISDTEYNNMLLAVGSQALAEHSKTEKYEGSIETQGLYRYGVDYNIGDIVSVINRYGISANPRIIGVIESVSDDGVTIVPTLSTWIGE